MTKNSPAADFSEGAITRAVAKITAGHPSVVYTGTAGALGLLSGALLNTGVLGWAIGLGGLTFALAAYGVNFFVRRERFANEYVERLYAEMEARRHQRLEQLRQGLSDVGSAAGESQFRRLTEKFETFSKMLASKLEPGELTHARYLATAEQVYLAALDNLHDLVNTLRSVNSIDKNYVDKRLQQLTASGRDEGVGEAAALRARLALLSSQQKKTERFLSQNEEAMTRMDEVIAALTELRTEDARAKVDLEAAMSQLQELAGRVHAYNS